MWLTGNNLLVNTYIFIIYVFMWERNFLAASSALLNKRNLYMVLVCVPSHYLAGFKVEA